MSTFVFIVGTLLAWLTIFLFAFATYKVLRNWMVEDYHKDPLAKFFADLIIGMGFAIDKALKEERDRKNGVIDEENV